MQQQLFRAIDEAGALVLGARGPGGFRRLQRGRDDGLEVRAVEVPDRLRRKHLPRQRRQLRPLLRRDPGAVFQSSVRLKLSTPDSSTLAPSSVMFRERSTSVNASLTCGSSPPCCTSEAKALADQPRPPWYS